ncbi:hypothetical protein LSAT2_013406, partial [Lamellibrachia satsuma]
GCSRSGGFDGRSGSGGSDMDGRYRCQANHSVFACFWPKPAAKYERCQRQPIIIFYMMMEDSMFGKLSAETNSYAALCQCEKGTDDKLWTLTDVVEMKAFVGLSMLMGINPMH